MKLSKIIIIAFVGGIIIVGSILFFLTKNKSTGTITRDIVKENLINKKTGIVTKDGMFMITKDTLKSFNIKNETVKNNKATIIAAITLEDLKKGEGSLNKYLVNNDMDYNLSGNVTLEYSKDNNQWSLDNVVSSNINYNKKEINVEIKEIPFNKTNNEIISDLKDVGIPVNSDNSTFTVTLNNGDLNNGYIPVDTINDLKTVKVTDQGAYKILTIHLDVNFTRNITNNIYEDNGKYSASGEIELMYQLKKDTKGTYTWQYTSLVTTNNITAKKI